MSGPSKDPSYSTYFKERGRSGWSYADFTDYWRHRGRTPPTKAWVRSLQAVVNGKWGDHERRTAKRLLNRASGEGAEAGGVITPTNTPGVVIHGPVIHGSNNTLGDNNPLLVNDTYIAPRPKRKQLPSVIPGAKRRRTMKGYHLTDKHNHLFRSRLNNAASKWILDSKRLSVEERLGQYIQAHKQESPAHSFIVDTNNKDIQELFGVEEWARIMEVVQPLPPLDETLEQYLNMFLDKTQGEMRSILEQGAYTAVSESGLGDAQRRSTYKNLAWAHYALLSIMHDYETGNIALPDNREKWYQTHVWAPFIDRLFETIPGIRFVSGECPTNATAARKNRLPGNRRSSGCLHDGVIKYYDHEVGAVENGGCNVIENDPKWTSDTLKLAKSNRDMIVKFHSQFGPAVRQVSTLGIITGGLNLGSLRMRYGGGSVCVLARDPVITVPTRIDHFAPMLKSMLHLWQIRMLAENSTTAIHTLLNQPLRRQGSPIIPLPASIDTDPPTEEGEISDSDVSENAEG